MKHKLFLKFLLWLLSSFVLGYALVPCIVSSSALPWLAIMVLATALVTVWLYVTFLMWKDYF